MSLLNRSKARRDENARRLFQSLFSWMSLLNGLDDDAEEHPAEFQSLFSWMSLLNPDNPDRLMILPYLFQSLFSWMSLLNTPLAVPGCRPHPVSILVLVDVALELQWISQRGGSILQFQSLFSWMSLLNTR